MNQGMRVSKRSARLGWETGGTPVWHQHEFPDDYVTCRKCTEESLLSLPTETQGLWECHGKPKSPAFDEWEQELSDRKALYQVPPVRPSCPGTPDWRIYMKLLVQGDMKLCMTPDCIQGPQCYKWAAVQVLTQAITGKVQYAVLTDFEEYMFFKLIPVIEGDKLMRWNLQVCVAYAFYAEPDRPTAYQAMYAFMNQKPGAPQWDMDQMLRDEDHPGCPLTRPLKEEQDIRYGKGPAVEVRS